MVQVGAVSRRPPSCAGGADAYSYSEGSEEGEAGPPPADLDAANAYDYYSGDEAEEGA